METASRGIPVATHVAGWNSLGTCPLQSPTRVNWQSSCRIWRNCSQRPGRWHDIGKALERDDADRAVSPFQQMLRAAGHDEPPHPRDDVDYAKSNGRGSPWGAGHRFRHEVASTLAYLTAEDADDLVAWLIMAHHGKARMTPTPWNDERLDDVAGVRPADRIPARAMSLVGRDGACELDPDLLLFLTHPPGLAGTSRDAAR